MVKIFFDKNIADLEKKINVFLSESQNKIKNLAFETVSCDGEILYYVLMYIDGEFRI